MKPEQCRKQWIDTYRWKHKIVWSCLVRTHEHDTEADAAACIARYEATDDLYAACEAVETWIEDETLNDLDELSDDCKALLATVKAALAKARGEVARG
jgi:hypothetical protein